MAKYGELGIDVRNVGFLTRYDENTYLEISFIGLVEPVSVCQQYRYLTCTGAYDTGVMTRLLMSKYGT